MSLLIWALALVATAGAAAVQGTVGVGFAMVCVPILSLLHPDLAPAPQLLVAIPMTGAMAWRERGSIEIKGIGWIIAGRIPGAILGVFLLGIATTRFLDAFIGLVVLGAVVIIGTGVHLNRTPVTKTIAGIASGTTGVVGSIGGPPIALIYSNEEAHTIRSTLAAVFTIGVLISTVFRWAGGHITMRDTQVAAVLFPAVVVGLYVAERVRDRISREHVRIAILIICAVAATALLVRAAVG